MFEIVQDDAFSEDHERFVVPPPFEKYEGDAEKLIILGFCATTSHADVVNVRGEPFVIPPETLPAA